MKEKEINLAIKRKIKVSILQSNEVGAANYITNNSAAAIFFKAGSFR